jgi:hypothetical protein
LRHYRRRRRGLRGTRRADRLPVWLGYGLLIVSVVLLIGQPLLVRLRHRGAAVQIHLDLCAALYSRPRGRAR